MSAHSKHCGVAAPFEQLHFPPSPSRDTSCSLSLFHFALDLCLPSVSPPPSLSLSSVCGGFRKSHDDDFPSNLRPVVPNPLCPLPSCIPCRQAKVLALLGNIAFLCCELVTGKCIKSITYSKICNVKRIGNFCSLDWLIQLGRTLKDDFLPLSMIALPTRKA